MEYLSLKEAATFLCGSVDKKIYGPALETLIDEVRNGKLKVKLKWDFKLDIPKEIERQKV